MTADSECSGATRPNPKLPHAFFDSSSSDGTCLVCGCLEGTPIHGDGMEAPAEPDYRRADDLGRPRHRTSCNDNACEGCLPNWPRRSEDDEPSCVGCSEPVYLTSGTGPAWHLPCWHRHEGAEAERTRIEKRLRKYLTGVERAGMSEGHTYMVRRCIEVALGITGREGEDAS